MRSSMACWSSRKWVLDIFMPSIQLTYPLLIGSLIGSGGCDHTLKVDVGVAPDVVLSDGERRVQYAPGEWQPPLLGEEEAAGGEQPAERTVRIVEFLDRVAGEAVLVVILHEEVHHFAEPGVHGQPY